MCASHVGRRQASVISTSIWEYIARLSQENRQRGIEERGSRCELREDERAVLHEERGPPRGSAQVLI